MTFFWPHLVASYPLPPPRAEEDSEAAALWIVESCRRWSAGVPSVPSLDTASPVGGPPGRARQQQQQLETKNWQCVKTLYPCSSHQNSWDLWM